MTRDDARFDPRWPYLYQWADGKWAARLRRRMPPLRNVLGGGGAVSVGIHKCRCLATRDHGVGHCTQLCTVCGHEDFTSALNDQTSR